MNNTVITLALHPMIENTLVLAFCHDNLQLNNLDGLLYVVLGCSPDHCYCILRKFSVLMVL